MDYRAGAHVEQTPAADRSALGRRRCACACCAAARAWVARAPPRPPAPGTRPAHGPATGLELNTTCMCVCTCVQTVVGHGHWHRDQLPSCPAHGVSRVPLMLHVHVPYRVSVYNIWVAATPARPAHCSAACTARTSGTHNTSGTPGCWHPAYNRGPRQPAHSTQATGPALLIA